MKKTSIYFLLSLTLLLQSCYSYRKISINQNLVENKKYKIKRFDVYEKVRLLSSTDSIVTVIGNKKVKYTIAREDIKEIKKRHLSATKLVLLPFGIAIVSITAIFAFGHPNVGPNFSNQK